MGVFHLFKIVQMVLNGMTCFLAVFWKEKSFSKNTYRRRPHELLTAENDDEQH